MRSRIAYPDFRRTAARARVAHERKSARESGACRAAHVHVRSDKLSGDRRLAIVAAASFSFPTHTDPNRRRPPFRPGGCRCAPCAGAARISTLVVSV